jgi:hypothetical protein
VAVNRRLVAACVLSAALASLATFVVVRSVDDGGSPRSPDVVPTSLLEPPPGVADLQAGCGLVVDTLRRAADEAGALNKAAGRSTAQPVGTQDVWSVGHQSDLESAVDKLLRAATVNGAWQPVFAAVKEAAATMSGTAPVGTDAALALDKAEAACTGR